MKDAHGHPEHSVGFQHRSSGLLLHLTSLPGPHGSGDLGAQAHRFIDFLAAAGQSWWQFLPTGPPGRPPAFSPYDSPSAFAGSPWLVSLELLAKQGLLDHGDLRPPPGLSASHVAFTQTLRFREPRLRRAFAQFDRRHGQRDRAFLEFRDAHADWLEDFALFMALRLQAGGKPWTEWDKPIRNREPSALRAAREQLEHEIAAQRFAQFEFHRQWTALLDHAHRRGVRLIGDLPIFVALDSADVWSHPDLFQIDRRGQPRNVSGYPPDRFNRHGQRWGHPQYDWARHKQTGFAWWVRRFTRMFELFDAVRIDHFLGFTRTWSIPTRSRGAAHGAWVKSPGALLFAEVEKKLGRRPMIAEDLGHVTAADIRLRNQFGLAPMRILQFGFGSEADSQEHLPHHYSKLCAAYTGNHDNDTITGWFQHLPSPLKRRVTAYLGGGGSSTAPHMAAIRALMASPANLVLFPMQDVLGLGQAARMNTPGTLEGNWQWRLLPAKLGRQARQMRQLTDVFERSLRNRDTTVTTQTRKVAR